MANKKYKFIFKTYTKQDCIKDNQSSIFFANNGSTTISINGYILQPGATLSLTDEDGNEDTTQYDITFQTGTGKLDVIQKLWV